MAFSDQSEAKGLFVGDEHNMDTILETPVNLNDTAMKQEDDIVSDGEEPEFHVKDEPIDEPYNAPAPTTDIVPMSLFSLATYQNMKWKLCDNDPSLTPLQRVQIKETAVSDSMQCIEALDAMYRKNVKQLPELQSHIDAIAKIRTDKKECEVKVGFLGTTGSGKSSLINCLLGHKDLLPADDARACTAVCVRIAWNNEVDQCKSFRAEIICIPESAWRAEIETLVKDIDDENHNRDLENGDPDLARSDRIKVALESIRSVYPQLKTKRDVLAANVVKLMADPRVQKMLKSRVQTFVESSLYQFASRIKPYIDSNNSVDDEDNENFTFWPLVKEVKLYVKSDILKDGVCLVDLPGNYDTNAARSAVAGKFTKELAVSFVVSPATRAATDKPAQDLLGAHKSRIMQLDGKFSTDRVVYVITKSDMSITVERYLKNYPGAKRGIGETLKQQKEAGRRKDKATAFQDDHLEKKSDLITRIETNRLQINALIKQYNACRATSESPSRKRKHEEETGSDSVKTKSQQSTLLSEIKQEVREKKAEGVKLKADLATASENLLQAQDKLAGIEAYLAHCESVLMSACIKHRHKTSQSAIQQDFESVVSKIRVRGTKAMEKELQVFSVSSLAYMALKNGSDFLGFADVKDTGIPNLREWLVECTIPSRTRCAEALLAAVTSFELSYLPRLLDRTLTHKMSTTECREIVTAFWRFHDLLLKEFKSSVAELVQACTKAVKGLFNQFSVMEKEAIKSAEVIVRNFPTEKLHWSTHRAINKYLGVYKQPANGAREETLFNWNEAQAGPYLDILIPKWTVTMGRNLPAARQTFLNNCTKDINAFAQEVATLTTKSCPNLATQINLWKASVTRQNINIDNLSKDVFDNIVRETVNESHGLIPTKIREEWEPMYRQCGAAKGKGHYKNNIKEHNNFIKEVKHKQLQRGNAAIRAVFKQLWKDLPEFFEDDMKEVLKQIEMEFQTFVDNHTLNTFNSVKKLMHDETVLVLKQLAVQWSIGMEFDEIETKIMVEPDLPSIDDLGQHAINEDDGGIMEISD